MIKRFLLILLFASFFICGYYTKKYNALAQIHSYFATSKSSYNQSSVQNLFDSQKLSFEELTENVRLFVNSNSQKVFNEKERKYNENDAKKMIKMMLENQSRKSIKPQLSCSARALVMQEILLSLGIQSRIVNYFSEHNGSHTFIEVFNKENEEWVLEDPDYNISYKLNGSDKKISLADTIINSNNKFKPCREGVCNWELADNLKVYTGAGLYFNFDHSPVILINQKKFNSKLTLKWDKQQRTLLKYVNDIWGENITKAILLVVN